MKIEAKQRLLASSLQTDASVAAKTEQFLKFIQADLKAKGFTRKAVKQSALYSWVFTREKDKRSIEISGWHGSGAYGSGKTLFTLTDTEDTGKHLWQVKPKIETTVDDSPKTHNDNVAKATAYIKAVK